MLSQNHEKKHHPPTSRASDYTPSVFLYVLAFATAFWCEPRKIYISLLYDIQRKRQALMVLELGKVMSQHTYYKLKILLSIKHIYYTYLGEDPGLSQRMGLVRLIPLMTTRRMGAMIHHNCQAGGEIILLFITAPVKDQNSQSSFYWIYIVFTPWWCQNLINWGLSIIMKDCDDNTINLSKCKIVYSHARCSNSISEIMSAYHR